MLRNALGLIEVVGLAAGVEAADAAVKAANVDLIGYELSKGGGMVVIKIYGDVGAVKAAIEAAASSASRVSKVVVSHVIPRPSEGLDHLITSRETVGFNNLAQGKNGAPEQGKGREPERRKVEAIPSQEEREAFDKPETIGTSTQESEGKDPFNEEESEPKRLHELCNLCKDPACPRRKGEPKVTCIHYHKEQDEEED